MGREPPAYQRALLRELAYLFGPEVGPEIQTHGHSFAERLAGDEELVAEICKRFEYALMLLRYHSPGFDEMVFEERVDLIEETCSHIYEFVEVLHKLMTFLEHGKPKRRGPAATKVASRDIEAAVLRDVDGLTNRQIADVLCINTPSDFLIKGDHPTMRKMVRRGRSALVAALGEEGWRDQSQAMKEEAKRWHSRSEIERRAELEAEALSVPYDEVLGRLEEESRRSGGGSERGVQEEVVL